MYLVSTLSSPRISTTAKAVLWNGLPVLKYQYALWIVIAHPRAVRYTLYAFLYLRTRYMSAVNAFSFVLILEVLPIGDSVLTRFQGFGSIPIRYLPSMRVGIDYPLPSLTRFGVNYSSCYEYYIHPFYSFIGCSVLVLRYALHYTHTLLPIAETPQPLGPGCFAGSSR